MNYTRNTMVREKIISVVGFVVFVACIILWNFMQNDSLENSKRTQFEKEVKVNQTSSPSASDIASIKK